VSMNRQPALMIVHDRRIHHVGRLGQGDDDEAVPKPMFKPETTFKTFELEPNVSPLQTQAARAAADILSKKTWQDIDQIIAAQERPMVTAAEGVGIAGGAALLIAGLLTKGDLGGILALIGLSSVTVSGVSAAFVR
jgi:hypothetical protein